LITAQNQGFCSEIGRLLTIERPGLFALAMRLHDRYFFNLRPSAPSADDFFPARQNLEPLKNSTMPGLGFVVKRSCLPLLWVEAVENSLSLSADDADYRRLKTNLLNWRFFVLKFRSNARLNPDVLKWLSAWAFNSTWDAP
jgi:hypothetical protein